MTLVRKEVCEPAGRDASAGGQKIGGGAHYSLAYARRTEPEKKDMGSAGNGLQKGYMDTCR